MALNSFIKCIALLRHPELVRYLGERRLEIKLLDVVRRQNPSLKLDSGVQLIAYEKARLELAEDITIRRGSLLAFGDDGNGFGRIRIGQGSWIGQYNNLRASGDGDIIIGSNCLISQFCTLVGSNHNIAKGNPIMAQGPDRSRLGVVLEDDVWLGAGVSVMPGVRVGRGAVIGANATVTREVPAYEVWGGVPARKIRVRN